MIFYKSVPVLGGFPLVCVSTVKRAPVLSSPCTTGSKTQGPDIEADDPTPHSYSSPFLAVWEVAVSREATGAETLPRVRVLRPLKAKGKKGKGSSQNSSDAGMRAGTSSNDNGNNRGRTVSTENRPPRQSEHAHGTRDLGLDPSCRVQLC